MKSLRKKILASALAVTLLGGAFMPKANAADATEDQIWKDLKITKILNKVEKGVTTPDAEFEFSFTPKTQGAPEIENVKIGYTAADNADADDTEAGIQVEKTEGVNLSNIQWPKSGEYEYELKEVIPKPGIEDMDYGYILNSRKYTKPVAGKLSPYKIRFKVEEINGKLEVTGITVSNLVSKREIKLNYDSEKGVKFKNYYDKKDGNTPTPGGGTDITDDDKKGFAFKKIVDSKNQTDLDKSFDFDLKVEKAVGSNSKDKEFKYVVVDKDGNVGGEQTAAYGTEFTVSLKDKERVVFTDVILGSKVSVSEKDSKGLTPSVKSDFFEEDKTASNDKTAAGIIGDTKGNYAEFTNKNAPLTGVLIDNLPYIALVAVAGLGIFFFVKNRREEEIYA